MRKVGNDTRELHHLAGRADSDKRGGRQLSPHFKTQSVLLDNLQFQW